MGIDFDSYLVCGWPLNTDCLHSYLLSQGVSITTCDDYTPPKKKGKMEKKVEERVCPCGSSCWDLPLPYGVEIINVNSTRDSSRPFDEGEFWINLVAPDTGYTLNKATQLNKVMRSNHYDVIKNFVKKLVKNDALVINEDGDVLEPSFTSFHTIS